MQSWQVPEDVFKQLIAGFVSHEADTLLRDTQPWDYEPGKPLLLGNEMGTVMAWLWRKDQFEATMALVGYISYLRKWSPIANGRPARILLDDVLASLRSTFPSHFTGAERDEFLAHTREQVPRYFDTDPNTL